ncbi:SDR family oxidoreductase [Frondihabitans peucedani]|uniref:SDR family oxidoreductase n=1 Tax=Frondihabitans peucedani TaxID=598626 RepID=A0ABP8DXB3_9MICO
MTNSNDLSLTGRTALVTGSTSGIGRAIALTLAGAGATVAVSGRDAERGQAVVDAIAAAGGRAVFVASDLDADPAALRAFATEAASALGGTPDILVNNAGVYPATATADLSDEDLDLMLRVNIRAPHVIVGEIAPRMAERGSGAIVGIGSWMSRTGVGFAALYSATKAADEQLTRTWASEFGPRGVRVNTVAPGATLTPGNEAARDVLDQMTAGTPLGSVVLPQDIADAVLFLVSDRARAIHGTTLDVDGGISATRQN